LAKNVSKKTSSPPSPEGDNKEHRAIEKNRSNLCGFTHSASRSSNMDAGILRFHRQFLIRRLVFPEGAKPAGDRNKIFEAGIYVLLA
jgi:hypothetical protein